MRVFLTGATGFIGSAIVGELVAAGHQVLGLARSDDKAAALAAAGAEVHRGSLEDLDGLRAGAAQAEGIIHTAFNHDFSRFAESCEDDRHVIAALSAEFAGSDRPLVVTSGVGAMKAAAGHLATEDDPHPSAAEFPRGASEEAMAAAIAAGANVSVVRLPQVHDTHKAGLVSPVIDVARDKGVSAYIGEGRNRWAAAHALDAARVYRLALERAEKGAHYHAVGEEGVPLRTIAEAIGRRFDLPVVSLQAEEAASHFGAFLGAFAQRDAPASSALTQQRLGWRPTGPSLVTDLENMEAVEDQRAFGLA
ncbi:MAG: SDR family oxidoreductase [Bauldia sp.]|nr:SDR family oxidoreductase [Bauldia sp.]